MGATSLEVADIFRRYGDDYRECHPLSYQQRRVMRAIELCRTKALGGHLWVCDQCEAEVPLYNSCGNRHCPKCQCLDKQRWLEARLRDVLPVEYFHVVFTVPHSLLPLLSGADSPYETIYGCYLAKQRSIRTSQYKLIAYPEAATLRLYDVKKDPLERNDLAGDASKKTVIDDLFSRLVKLQREMNDDLDLSELMPSEE